MERLFRRPLSMTSSNWESIIFPTGTNYFGDVPDVDSNCQVEVAILSIDGVGSTEGYFNPEYHRLGGNFLRY